MEIEQNPYNMPCMVCGRFLIYGQISSRVSKGLNKLVTINSERITNLSSLICPQNHGYTLTDITSTIKAEEINIEINQNVVNSFKKEDDFYNFDLKNLIYNNKTKMYAVAYNTMARIRSDRLKFGRKPSPSNQVLDSIIFYICAETNEIVPDQEAKKIIFAVAGEKVKGVNFIYRIVWYYLRGSKDV